MIIGGTSIMGPSEIALVHYETDMILGMTRINMCVLTRTFESESLIYF